MKLLTIPIRYFLFLGVLAFPMACHQTPVAHTNSDSDKKERSMSVAHKTEPEAIEIPPIDRAVPSAFETATFGLG